ncbi:MAG: fluoride efflux transporter FluC [Flavobacteriales bacterium]
MNYLLVFIGGGLGSVLRFALTNLLGSSAFIWATWTANILAACVIGLLVGLGVRENQPPYWLLLAVGFCGGLSTFSTFSLETLQLIKQDSWMLLAFQVLSTVIVSVGAVYLFTQISQK